jgi:hypothetical protein
LTGDVGGSATDQEWFIVSPSDVVTDLEPGEKKTVI